MKGGSILTLAVLGVAAYALLKGKSTSTAETDYGASGGGSYTSPDATPGTPISYPTYSGGGAGTYTGGGPGFSWVPTRTGMALVPAATPSYPVMGEAFTGGNRPYALGGWYAKPAIKLTDYEKKAGGFTTFYTQYSQPAPRASPISPQQRIAAATAGYAGNVAFAQRLLAKPGITPETRAIAEGILKGAV